MADMYSKFTLSLFALLVFAASAWGRPQTVDLTKEWERSSLTNQFVYASWKNFAPPFATDQAHEGLSDLLDVNGDSMLCFPASLTTALVKQYSFQDSPLSSLKLPGISAGKNEVDLNEIVRDLIVRCKTDTNEGTYMSDGANCLRDVYKESGIENPDIKLIRTFKSDIETPDIPNIVKKVEIQDVISSIDNGYEVIGFIKWSEPNPEADSWEGRGGHFVNIFGYARQIPWKDLVVLYISNPIRGYPNTSYYQVYDSVLAQVIPEERPLSVPGYMGDIVLEGPGFTGKVNRGFLSGLLIFKP